MGVPFDHLTLEEAMRLIEQMISSGQPHYLVTANVDFLVQARGDAELRRILLDADLVLCDGTPLVWASRLLGNPLPERVAGSDLVPFLLQVAASKSYRIFLLGATPESASRAVDRLRVQYPQLVIAGHYSPPFNPLLDMDHEEIGRRIRKAAPDILLVSFGCPKQEKWMVMHYRSVGVPVTIGVGATIDFLAGHHRRAPVWMRKTGTEWLYRLAHEPRRLFRRYTNDLWVFGRGFLAQYWQLQLRPSRRARRPTLASANPIPPPQAAGIQPSAELAIASCHVARLPERVDLAAFCSGALQAEMRINGARHCLLDAASVRFIDSTGVGELMRWERKLRIRGGSLILVAPSVAVKRALKLMRLHELFISTADLASARDLVGAETDRPVSPVAWVVSSQGRALLWAGEVTAANAEAVWEQTAARLREFLPSEPWRIDLGAVRFIDSSGLGIMVRAKKLAREEKKSLTFETLQPNVLNVVRLARLEAFLLDTPPARGLLKR